MKCRRVSLSRSLLLLPLVAGGVTTPASAQDFDFGKLKFMSGCWAAPFGEKNSTVEEIWTSPSDNLMLATTRYLTKNTATSFEFTRIEKSDSGIAYIAATEGGTPSYYTLTQLSDEIAIWENRTQNFPQRIMYRLASDGSLIARNDKIDDYDPRNVEVRLEAVDCPGVGRKRR